MLFTLAKVFVLIAVQGPLINATDFFDDAKREKTSLEIGIEEGDNATTSFLNFGQNADENQRYWYEHFEDIEKTLRNKADVLSRFLKFHIDRIRNQTDQVDLVFLVDASGSVGAENFQSELNFVKKLLSDFTVKSTAARIAVVTFGGRRNINRNIDQISRSGDNDHKCYLLNKQLNNISYSGGGTYTRGALLEALAILEKGRGTAKKVVFLITDGFSNGGDPRPAANLVKDAGATVFTFGIRTGNVGELFDIASSPGYTHSYLLDSFAEFEALARRALHRDLKIGEYVPVTRPEDCHILCIKANKTNNAEECCDDLATCACGVATGHYSCICPTGYYGSGFKGFCQPCPNGTYASGELSGDSTAICTSCPDVNHVTIKVPATSVQHCVCATGFITDGNKCEVITCPKLKVPENGYLVKASACSNVVHAACGIRCKIGFYLTGDSIRLCGKDGSWSGNEPKCLLKTCAALRAPTHGRMRCYHDEDYQHKIKEDSTTYPIDTRCQFRCEPGYQLRGSKVRNCLPLPQWDGLKAACKAIKCEPLKHVANGEILPKDCSGPQKVSYGTNCKIACKKGFVLEGPRNRLCGGRTGIWTQRHNVNRCIDKSPPSITCPSDIILESLPGENYAYVNWTQPEVTDNTDQMPIVWTKPHITFPWKVKIGSRTVLYTVQDSSGNKARCKFKVKVIDNEPPMMENCIDPPVYFTFGSTEIYNISWAEPGFYDNSKVPVHVKQSHFLESNFFPLGQTTITYNATDKYDNFATCTLNVTVEDICQDEYLTPLRGQINCSSTNAHTKECIMSCDEQYDFAVEPPGFQVADRDLLLKCNNENGTWNDSIYIPECSETYVPKVISQEGSVVLEGNDSVICENQTTLRELSKHITDDLRLILLDICGNDIECNLITFDPECEDFSEIAHSNVTRKRRDTFGNDDSYQDLRFLDDITTNYGKKIKRTVKENSNKEKNKTKSNKREKIDIKFKFVAKIIDENYENPRQGVQKLREKIAAMTRAGKLNLLNNRTNQEIAKLALNLHLVFKEPQQLCDKGSILKKHSCVKCPLGTFHNSMNNNCQACPFGQYQNVTGSVACKNCPKHTSTKKMHTKFPKDCIPVCRPGYYSRRKRYHGPHLSLEPCWTCDIGFYQPEYGKLHCISCPSNMTTNARGSTDIKDCLPLHKAEDICQSKPCLHDGDCVQEEDGFSCECRDGYLGSKCEKFQNPCDSSPCLNEGICSVQNHLNRSVLYTCTCKNGYKGSNCEVREDICEILTMEVSHLNHTPFQLYIDECTANPCLNGGKCISNESDYECQCRDGFEGHFCELSMDHCTSEPCAEGSTCRTVNETWACLCRPGFLGRHCNLLPCDWIPCHPNSICVNIADPNATRKSYRCECPAGYTGEDCTIKIQYCRKLSSDYVLHFTKSGTTDYVMMKGPTRNLSELTVCLWLQSEDTFNYGTVLSYATYYYDNTFTLTDYNGFVLYINGQKAVTDIKVNDGRWHFLCLTWESKTGSWEVHIDGFLRDNGTNLAKGSVIQGNGSLVLGQEQDRIGGGFSESESFLGKLSLLDIWDRILERNDIRRILTSCERYYGNIISWSQVQIYIRGDVMVSNGPFCRGCPLPVVPFRGKINVTEDLSEVTYYCDPGYIVRFGGREYQSLRLKCLKQGHWEGYYTPSCIKKKCGFPGYFPRGYIHGWSYLFGDEVHYACMSGYELRGNPRRICNTDGKWSGLPPICIGKTCKNLLAPENGDIEYIIEENERDDITILQVGQQLEFKCDPGFRLSGERYLTCIDSGIWDHDRPTCISNGCLPPKEIDHGYMTFTNTSTPVNSFATSGSFNATEDSSQKAYFYDDIVAFSCHRGYKFRGNHNLLTEFKLRCSENGTWTGFVPDCVPLGCPWPNPIQNASIFLKTRNNETVKIPAIPTLMNNNQSFNVASAGSNVSLNGDEALKELFIPGAQIVVVCDPGFQLNGESIITCTDKENWSSASIFCEPLTCSIMEHPLFRFINTTRNEVIAENNTGPLSSSKYNKWNMLKDYQGSFGNAEYLIEGSTYKKKIIFKCANDTRIKLNEAMTKPLTNITWYCNESGDWEILDSITDKSKFGQLFHNLLYHVCQKMTCPTLTVPEHGHIVSNNGVDSTDYLKDINSTVSFKCRQGYILIGSKESKCLTNGTWTTIPLCKPVACVKPATLLNAALKSNNSGITDFTFGDVITYECMRGYQMFGQANARCLATGKWSRIYGKCSKISCGKPKIPPGVIVQGRSYLYQDQLTYICPKGKKQGLIMCEANGKWSAPPNCNN
ncbi:hypothetical protein KM043_013441 [Ampulex compressa]|nr:hypothetical protein KM043_013441 [Ampulex compressa]